MFYTFKSLYLKSNLIHFSGNEVSYVSNISLPSQSWKTNQDLKKKNPTVLIVRQVFELYLVTQKTGLPKTYLSRTAVSSYAKDKKPKKPKSLNMSLIKYLE